MKRGRFHFCTIIKDISLSLTSAGPVFSNALNRPRIAVRTRSVSRSVGELKLLGNFSIAIQDSQTSREGPEPDAGIAFVRQSKEMPIRGQELSEKKVSGLTSVMAFNTC